MKATIYRVDGRCVWGVVLSNGGSARVAFHPFFPPFKPGVEVGMFWGINRVRLQ